MPPSLSVILLVFVCLETSALRSLHNCSCSSHVRNSHLREFSTDHSKLTLSVPHFPVVFFFFSSLCLSLYEISMQLIIYLFSCLFSVLVIWSELHKKRVVVFLVHHSLPSAKNHVWQIGRTQYILVRWMNNYRILI